MNKTLNLFNCSLIRTKEEAFCKILTENDEVRLFFINENEAFTDGKNIIVDPAFKNLFSDTKALSDTEKYLNIKPLVSTNEWSALKMITRAQSIHECLHILYSTFPPPFISDTRSSNSVRKATLSLISNIIEDAFVEAAGCSVFDSIELFLSFFRVANLFCNTQVDGTAKRAFADDNKALSPLLSYIEYMANFLLYPMIEQDVPECVADYIEKTKHLFLQGSVCGDPKERYTFSQRIFDVIEPLIPESDEAIDTKVLERMLIGIKTHTDNNAITNFKSEGKQVKVLRRLFSDLDGNAINNPELNDSLTDNICSFEEEKTEVINLNSYQPKIEIYTGEAFDCHVMHKGITIIETKPKPILNFQKAYKNISDKNRLCINSYSNRFAQLLNEKVPFRQEKQLFGAGISSKNLFDVKKRHWYKNSDEESTEAISIMLLVDGSGSMLGTLNAKAMETCVILHEVLKKQRIQHAIVEHRAIFYQPKVLHNILVDFNCRDDEKYNLLLLDAFEGTREGLSLYWAENYLLKNTETEKRLIIVISDGEPCHEANNNDGYFPPVSSMDTKNAAKKIISRGTEIIAIALDNNNASSCYDVLSKIYPTTIACTDLSRLTSQIFGVIAKRIG